MGRADIDFERDLAEWFTISDSDDVGTVGAGPPAKNPECETTNTVLY
jgi:hypothetical protein